MKLKSRIVMILLLTGMLLLTLIGGITRKKDDSEPQPQTDPVVVIDDGVMPDSFKGAVEDPYNVPAEVMDVIVSYLDGYYRSLYTLEKQDLSSLFENEYIAAVSEKAIDLQIETRKLYDFDFTLKKAHYDLKVTRYEKDGDTYQVDILEDDYMNFAFLNGIESQTFDVENYFVIKDTSDGYRISDLEKIQGYYMTFYDETDTVEEVSFEYDYYMEQLKGMIGYNTEVLKQKAEKDPYISNVTYTKAYNREAAVAYADQYYHQRNRDWYNFSDEGGNCQNYASQCMLAGGMDMDYTGDWQWKCYVTDPDYEPEINEEDEKSGRSRSWVHVTSFYDYAKENEGKGLACDVNANLYYAQPGDIILVGNGGLSHTVIVSKVVDGHILVDSNSIDMKDYPVEAYTYTNITLIKILGSN